MGTVTATPSGESPSWGHRLVAPALLLVGVGLVVLSIVSGSARWYFFVFIPIVAGNSALLVLGAILIFLGIAFLPTAFRRGDGEDIPGPRDPNSPGTTPSGSRSSGGLLLVGPVPIFWGDWKNAPRWAYVLPSVVGGLFVVLLVLYFLGLL